MKRILAILVVLLLLLTGCTKPRYRKDVTLEEVVEAYEAAGYSVWADTYVEPLEHGEIASIQANHPDGDYIYFAFFQSEEDAIAYKQEFYHPVTMGLFSLIYGQPSWQRWEVLGCIVMEFDNPDFVEPFKELARIN